MRRVLVVVLCAACDSGEPSTSLEDLLGPRIEVQLDDVSFTPDGEIDVQIRAMGCPRLDPEITATLNGREMDVQDLGGIRTVHDPGEPGIFGRPPSTSQRCFMPVFAVHGMPTGPTATLVIADRSSRRLVVEIAGGAPRRVTGPPGTVSRGRQIAFVWEPATDVLGYAGVGVMHGLNDVPLYVPFMELRVEGSSWIGTIPMDLPDWVTVLALAEVCASPQVVRCEGAACHVTACIRWPRAAYVTVAPYVM